MDILLLSAPVILDQSITVNQFGSYASTAAMPARQLCMPARQLCQPGSYASTAALNII
jgi:hypothetical protein